MKSFAKLSIQLFSIGLFSVVIGQFSATIKAQERSTGSPAVTTDHDFEARSDTIRNMSENKSTPGKPEPKPNPEQVLREAREDYMFLQVDNKALKQALTANTALEPKALADSLADVRKRAERLSINLALPELDKKAERMKITAATSPDEFKASVSNLSSLIRAFITNPCFREPALLVNEQTSKARVDLTDIIALSKQLQKDSEKLATAKP